MAADASLVCIRQNDRVSRREERRGEYPSEWVVSARSGEDLGRLFLDTRWELLASRTHAGVWTDDYSNILRMFRW